MDQRLVSLSCAPAAENIATCQTVFRQSVSQSVLQRWHNPWSNWLHFAPSICIAHSSEQKERWRRCQALPGQTAGPQGRIQEHPGSSPYTSLHKLGRTVIFNKCSTRFFKLIQTLPKSFKVLSTSIRSLHLVLPLCLGGGFAGHRREINESDPESSEISAMSSESKTRQKGSKRR